MLLSVHGKERLQFGNVRHILLVQKGYLHTLYAEKFEYQRILLSLEIKYDQEFKRVIIPEKNRRRYQQVFREILNVQEEISSVHRIIQITQAEMFFLQMAD